ncbi:hypothetical protein KDK_12510 [Dictyobacter kobayashii]|uniref:Uncharacterized protein n=1 Tax=Dictyobacter kobayashii TaxID=2014872 RepID=A0A402AED3_9CHLR|nr:hypothetical protein KDK_12510 [Dictyobacter kobayashii]
MFSASFLCPHPQLYLTRLRIDKKIEILGWLGAKGNVGWRLGYLLKPDQPDGQIGKHSGILVMRNKRGIRNRYIIGIDFLRASRCIGLSLAR